MGVLLCELADEYFKRRNRNWDWVAQQFGYRDVNDCEAAGYVCGIDWVNRAFYLEKNNGTT